MPELPEIHALTADLGSRLDDRIVEKLETVSVAALKTFAPALSALVGSTIGGVSRHGKFLDHTCVRKAAGDLRVIVRLGAEDGKEVGHAGTQSHRTCLSRLR